MQKINKPYQITRDGSVAKIYIYGDIEKYEYMDSDVTSYSFKEELQECSGADRLEVHINSYGGVVSEGLAIYNLLKNVKSKVIVKIDGFACSIASVIAMAGGEIHMPRTALMMIHKPWTYASGNADDLRKQAQDLDSVLSPSVEAYMSKINISRDKLIELLTAETWLTADEALAMGFCSHITETEDNTKQCMTDINIRHLVMENKALSEKLNTKPKTTKDILNNYFN